MMTKQIAYRICSLTLAILMPLSIFGCEGKYDKETVMLFTQVFHAVPGVRSFDPNVINSKIIDTDNYGRVLFVFKTAGESGICIMQKSDDSYVYYYDNFSYSFTKYYSQYTSEQLDLLKELNDWNRAFNENMMVKREYIDSKLEPKRVSVINWDIAQNAYYDSMEDNDYITGIEFFDYSISGQEIFLVRTYEQIVTKYDHDWRLLDYHLMILNDDGTYDPENYLVKIDDLSQSNEALAEIKERNGWVG